MVRKTMVLRPTIHFTSQVGTYNITAVGDAFNVNDELNITGTTMTIDAKKDGVKVDNDEDTSVGTIYLSDNTITVTAGGRWYPRIR